MRRLGLMLLLAVAAGCHGCRRPVPPPVEPSPSPSPPPPAAPLDGGPATCLDVCRHGQALGCTWAADTDMGVPCSTVCSNNQTVAITLWDLDCRVRQSSCAAIDANCK